MNLVIKVIKLRMIPTIATDAKHVRGAKGLSSMNGPVN